MEPAEFLRCRICLSQGRVCSDNSKNSTYPNRSVVLRKLFPVDSQLYYLKIMTCAKTLISQDDGLPQFLCCTCLKNLEISFNFRRQCEMSDEKLRLNLNKMYSPTEMFEVHTSFIKNISFSGVESLNVSKKCLKTSENPNIENKFLVSKPAQNPAINLQQSSDGKKYFQCERCGKIFNKNSKLKIHLRTHTGEKPFICSVCGKAFRVSHHLQCHNRIHDSTRPYDCSICGKSFTENSSLLRHLKIHNNDKKFQCPLCFKKFIDLYSMQRHLVKHSGDRPYKCKYCQKRYSDPSTLSRHIKIHKNEEVSTNRLNSKTNSPI